MSFRKNDPLTYGRLLEALTYDPETGIFTRNPRAGNSRFVRTWNTRYANQIANHVRPDGYVDITIDYYSYQAHRLAFFYVHGKWPRDHIDHIDRDKRNNRLTNLREATRSQNLCNRSHTKTSQSGVKGVSFDKRRGNWRAEIKYQGRATHLGTYDSIEEARSAYRRAGIELHGEFFHSD